MFVAGRVELPADFYEVVVPLPETWPEDGARYVQLSPAYDDAAAEARRRGWPVVGGPSMAHLDVANHPVLVAGSWRDVPRSGRSTPGNGR